MLLSHAERALFRQHQPISVILVVSTQYSPLKIRVRAYDGIFRNCSLDRYSTVASIFNLFVPLITRDRQQARRQPISKA